jgi:hypothetical protein
MTVRIYRSSDVGAPALTGQVNSLINVLSACLVDGYGAQAPALWTKEFTDVNKAVFRAGAGPKHYIRIDDSGPGVNGAAEARVRAFESMTDVDTGTFPYPTTSQRANGIFIRKSATADATVRQWIVLADEHTMYMLVSTGGTLDWIGWSFGEFFSFSSIDAQWRSVLIANNNEGTISASDVSLSRAFTPGPGSSDAAIYIARSEDGTVNSIQGSIYGDRSLSSISTNNAANTGLLAAPNPVDGGFYVSRVTLAYLSSATIRGVLRGFHHWGHPRGSVGNAIINGSGNFAGKQLQLIDAGSGLNASYLLEISNTWELN